MPVEITSTKEASQLHGVKCLVYGPAGSGKTTLCATAPDPLIISAESGLLALREADIPVITIKNYNDLMEAYEYVTQNPEAKQYKTICLDSLSEIAEVILAHEKEVVKDPRAAYGELIEKTMGLCRAFRDLSGFNVYFAAKMERVKDEASGIMLYQPSMPGTKLGNNIPYLFDLVMYLGVGKDTEGNEIRALQTYTDLQYVGKDRSGVLEAYEAPDLGVIFKKIINS